MGGVEGSEGGGDEGVSLVKRLSVESVVELLSVSVSSEELSSSSVEFRRECERDQGSPGDDVDDDDDDVDSRRFEQRSFSR